MAFPLAVRTYVAGLAVVGGLLVVALSSVADDRGLDRPWLVLAFAGLLAVEHASGTRLVRRGRHGESISHEESVLVALALLVSPVSVLATFALGFLIGSIAARRGLLKSVFNVADEIVSVAAALLVIEALGGADASSARGVANVFAGAAVFLVVNNASVATVLTLAGAGSFRGIFLDDIRARAYVWTGNIAIGLLVGLAGAVNTWTLPIGIAAMLVLQFTLSGHVRARAERQKLADIVGSSSDGIFTVDRQGRIGSWNAAMERSTLRTAEDVAGRPLAQALDLVEPDAPAFERLLAEDFASAGGEPVQARIRAASGEERWLALAPSSLPERGWVFVARDFTERKRTHEALREQEEQLRQAQKLEAIGRLAGGIAHDFNNLLTTIGGYAKLLLAQAESGSAQRTSAEEIKKAADRAGMLTRQLLAYGRKQMLQPKLLDLNAVVADLEGMLRRLIAEDVALVTILGSDLGRVRADPTQLEQVVMNLCLNARDAMPLGGRLTIETRNADPYVELVVSDTGSGMDEETRERIFEPFFTTKLGQGTGLGLATVYGIVRQSGGSIAVESEPGRGSTFTVSLPRLEGPAEETEPSRAAPALEGGSETILVAEDEYGLRELVRTVLELHGYTVLVAATAETAVGIAEAHDGPIDVLVTDVVLPEMSGSELAQALRATRPEAAVIFMSGYTEDEIVRRGVLTSSVAFLQKPFDTDFLVEKVREALDRAPVEQAAPVKRR